MRTFKRTARAFTVGTAVTALIMTAGIQAAAASVAGPGCTTMTQDIQRYVHPTSGVNQLVPGSSGAGADPTFTDARGVLVRASATPINNNEYGTVAVHRLHKPATGDYVWIGNPKERDNAVAVYGYVDQGVQFYARWADGSGCVPIYRYIKGSIHTFVAEAGRAELAAAGWRSEGVAFYGAAPAPTAPLESTTFSFVVIPDTQTWTGNDIRFKNATAWIASQKVDRNLKWVLHTGDFVNWGWLDQSQYDVANTAMKNLQDAGIPYGVSIGNHDTRVVGIGGGSYVFQNNKLDCEARFGKPECKAALLNRHTEEFNANQNASMFTNVSHTFEPGKVDNIFQTFSAGNKSWMVLTLELDARPEVVTWAKGIIAANPTKNVIIQTHNYLTGAGTISGPIGYGTTSPQYIYDNLVSKHDNVKMVFSGHQGSAAYRTDTFNGNKVHSFLMNSIGGGNSLRIMTVDTATGAFTSKIYNQSTNTWVTQYDISGTMTVK